MTYWSDTNSCRSLVTFAQTGRWLTPDELDAARSDLENLDSDEPNAGEMDFAGESDEDEQQYLVSKPTRVCDLCQTDITATASERARQWLVSEVTLWERHRAVHHSAHETVNRLIRSRIANSECSMI